MTSRKRASLLIAAAVVAVSCSKIGPITGPALAPGRADFSVVAALGSAITAGFQSGGLVSRHQTTSYASLFAAQVRAHSMDLPLIDGDGIPPLLELKHFYPPPIQIGPISTTLGNPTNVGLGTTYHNLAIPGARVQDVTDTTHYQAAPRDTFFNVIQRKHGSLARQIATQLDPPPTFLLFEFGSSELLRPALNGTIVGLTTVASFADSFRLALDSLAALLPNAKLAVVNVPDVTQLPFFTTVSNKQLDANGRPVVDANGRTKFLLGPLFDSSGKPLPLGASDQVLLSARSAVANGYGYPIGTFSYLSGSPVAGQGIGLTDAQVLSNSEVLTVQDRVNKFNASIDTTSRSVTHPHDFAVVDLDGLLRRAKSPGIELRGVVYTTRFVTGGLISLDGVHPNDVCHALLCNELIGAVNAKFGSNIQPLDPLKFATPTSSGASASRSP